MTDSSKKISFSFSKTKKPPLTKKVEKPKEGIEFVSCFDNAEEKLKRSNEAKPLIIPLTDSRNCHQVLESRIEKKKESKKPIKVESNEHESNKTNSSNSDSDKKLTELAAAEILNDAQNKNEKSLGTQKIITEQDKVHLSNEPENDVNDIDYDSVPVTDFGLAMLRGMGWKPNSGIGKNPRIVATTSPKLRPKGLGLGVNKPEANSEPKSKK